MQIKTAEFIKGIVGSDPILSDGRAEIAFVGRSNVGKSSLINSLTKRKNLVKVSSSPGRTKEINFFLINDELYFVDLPGYGYASVSQKEQESIRERIVWYLQTDEIEDKSVVIVLDIKVGVTDFDKQVINILRELDIPYVLIANKADNVRAVDHKYAVQNIRNESRTSPMIPIVLYSSKTGLGRNELTSILLK